VATVGSGFRGWPETALRFFEGLEADNTKTYWLDHKDMYEREVRSPMQALLADLEAEFGPAHLFRPYRDTRFSADKRPYKTSVAAMVGGFRYVSMSARGLTAGSGIHHMSADQLERYRAAVIAQTSGPALARIASDLGARDVRVHGQDELRTAPRGYPRDHPLADLVRYKGIIAGVTWPPGDWLHTAEAGGRVAELFRRMTPFVDWVASHVGAPDSTRPVRTRP